MTAPLPERRPVRSAAVVGVLILLLLGAYPGWLLWTDNFHEVLPGALYRAGQLDRDELTTAIRRHRIRAVLNLRGPNGGKRWYDDETRACRDLAVEHVDFRMSARSELTSEQVRDLDELLCGLPQPVLIHCNGGSDRTGLAAALHVLRRKGGTPEEARRQLSWRYGHVPILWWSSTAAMDRSLTRIVEEAEARINTVCK
ncbi:MAG TPA: tyrosine-protein phosphatase [Verrucomicrobiota bacterium]|nr:tyrosine-protein phosphatase [Verrucomicrobiota bacterium]HNU49776.1 tyrosine-protein phosphatase [Verrucomicrobiota bacterium]